MSVVIDGTTGITAAAFDGAVDGADLTGNVAAARITGALNATGSAPIYACRAWVNFNGTGTVAIRASGNVSSITDNGTGDYTVNFTTAMSDANYSAVASCQIPAVIGNARVVNHSIGSVKILTTTTGGAADADPVSVAVFR